ncbi:hypothetical protein CHS0354_021794 [Potamilus streckersoni]|uniref:LolA-like domain-containing protein n=1 Tax=Potamilus streckersoni TaxID=2493646 RepID=A0AAE0S421_9BIVA|nr:hypothetical protein CHS0354_021794 [Potamilus streckersoni]
MGNATILGMSVQHWQACIYWNATNSTFLVDYYFTQNWDTASTYQHVPVRANVTGSKWQNGTQTFFNHVYDYYAFHVTLDQDPDIFTTPKGVICPGRKRTRPIPQLPDYFYFRVEVIYPDLGTVSAIDHRKLLARFLIWFMEPRLEPLCHGHTLFEQTDSLKATIGNFMKKQCEVSKKTRKKSQEKKEARIPVAEDFYKRVWYDEDYKLYRKDYRPLSPDDPTYTTNPLTEIHDFNTGNF